MNDLEILQLAVDEMQRISPGHSIFVNPVMLERCKEAGIDLGPHFLPTKRLDFTPTPQATTEGVTEVLRKLWKEQP